MARPFGRALACRTHRIRSAVTLPLVARTRCLALRYVPSSRFQTSAGSLAAAGELLIDSGHSFSAPSRLHGSQAPGGARRDRTDDLMLAKHALSQLSYGPSRMRTVAGRVVGLGRLERPTSPLSGVRSNHLSYRPDTPRRSADERSTPITLMSGEERETKTAASRIAGPDWPHLFLQSSDTIGRDGVS